MKLWSHDGKLLQTLTGHEGTVIGINFSPDRKSIATVNTDNTVKLWSRDGKLLQTFPGEYEGKVYSVSFSS